MRRFIFSIRGGYAAAGLAALGFSFKSIWIHQAYDYNTDTMTLLLMRMFMAVPLYIIALFVTEGRRIRNPDRREWGRYVYMGLLGAGGSMYFSFEAIRLLGASLGTIVVYIYPSMTIAMGAIRNRQLPLRRLLIGIIALMGLSLAMKANGGNASEDHLLGIVYGLISAVCFALYNLSYERLPAEISSLRAAFFSRTLFLLQYPMGYVIIRSNQKSGYWTHKEGSEMKKLVILGAGTGGTIMANVMRRKLDSKEWSITIIDQTTEHIYQPGLLFLPFSLYGYNGPEAVRRPRREFVPAGVTFVNAEIKLIDHANQWIETETAGNFEYDYLVIALGVDIHPEDIDGMTAAMGRNAYSFYQLEGALGLQRALSRMEKGRLVLNIAEMPIKCPVAPIEFVYLADYFFRKKGIRDKIEIVFSTPLGGVFTKPIAASVFSRYIEEKKIKTEANFNIGEVDHESKVMRSFDGHEIPYDILVTIPPNIGPEVIDTSTLGNGAGYAQVDENTLRSTIADRIFVLGDVANVHTSKAGSVAHFMSEVVADNLYADMMGKELTASYDGHSNCFIESGDHKAFLIDFNYETEPLPGNFPLPGIGPFKLLKETYTNHLGKMAFRRLYWNRMMKGLPVAPFGLVKAQMPTKGKQMELLQV